MMKKATYDHHSSSSINFLDGQLDRDIMEDFIVDSKDAQVMYQNRAAKGKKCGAMLFPFDMIRASQTDKGPVMIVEIGRIERYAFSHEAWNKLNKKLKMPFSKMVELRDKNHTVEFGTARLHLAR